MNRFFTRPDCSIHPGFFPAPALVEHTISGAPAFMQGLKALFVSDVHLRPCVSDAKLDAFMAQLDAVRADVLLLGGDYAETPQQCLRFFDALGALHFPLGFFAVPGNNDFDSMATLHDTVSRAGGALLVNESRCIPVPGGRLEIGGCDEYKFGTPRTGALFSNSGAYRVLLSHYPVQPECACELMLCGHTHAGQFNFLGVTPYTLGFERDLGLLALRGRHRIGSMDLIVGNGVGVSRAPLRAGAQPQIYLLKFAAPDLS